MWVRSRDETGRPGSGAGRHRQSRSVTGLALVLLVACAGARGPAPVAADEAEEPAFQTESRVYYYPLHGQSAERENRDRYECYRWAVQKSDFDPGQPGLAPHQRVIVVPDPAHEVVRGAVAGAAVGAIVGHPHHTGGGAAIGAAVGALAGAAEAGQIRREAQQHEEDLEARRLAALERLASNYKRAMSACLEGRGYAVR